MIEEDIEAAARGIGAFGEAADFHEAQTAAGFHEEALFGSEAGGVGLAR